MSKAKDGGKKEERERERLNDGDKNGQATHGARKHAWRTHGARMAHASCLGQNFSEEKLHSPNLSIGSSVSIQTRKKLTNLPPKVHKFYL